MSLLVLDDVKVHFGGVRAVDGVSLSVERGELCGIIGPNGSGKTTTLNAITRAVNLTSGSITFDGHRIDGLPAHEMRRRGLMRTFQGIRLVPSLTVRDNVRLAAEQRGPGGAASARTEAPVDDVVDDVLDRLRLRDLRDELPATLPYGTQRRVEIARALATGPELVLLDEPVAGMSASERVEIADILRGLREDGLTMVVIEHDLRMLLNLADQLAVLNFGQLLAFGEPHATARLPEVQRAYLGDADHA